VLSRRFPLLWAIVALVPLTAARAEPLPTPANLLRAVPVPVLSAEDRDALGRVAYAEAGSQGEEGLAAVAHAVLNRVASGRFGAGVQGVLDAPGQFEPVGRAGGTWRGLSPLTEPRRLVFGTILDLILQGRLPDLTGGSTYFQNPAIVAQRAAAGLVSPGLVNFGGRAPAAVIRDHSFYRAAGAHGPAPEPRRPGVTASQPAAGFYRVVNGQLVQAGVTLADPVFTDPASSSAPVAKFIRVGAVHAPNAGRIHVLRGAGFLKAGPPAS
jgi:N-acetylmuramoyl-L-alanine amidase